MRAPPVGIDSFSKVRELELAYADKSRMIGRILDLPQIEAFLFLRPRRFGKSLNLSMLNAYFNMEYKGKAEEWFDGLEITRLRPDDPEMSASPVIHITLKNLGKGTMEEFEELMSERIGHLARRYKYLYRSDALDDDDKALLRSMVNETRGKKLKGSLLTLSELLERHHGRKVIILIDEYDDPVNKAYKRSGQEGITDFCRDLLGNALKTNPHLRFAVVTGAMQIAKEGIFTGMNNLHVDSILSTGFEDMFGYTEDDVRAILEDSEHLEKFDEVREWYDGYRFGDAEVYNPWSVNSYVADGFSPACYWANTSANKIIVDLLNSPDSKVKSGMRELIAGRSVSAKVDPRVSYDDIHSTDIFAVMTMSGYLKAMPGVSEGMYSLEIPNLEMRRVFARMIIDRGGSEQQDRADEVVKAFIDGDPGRMEAALREVLLDQNSLLLGVEGNYHMLVSTIFYTSTTHDVTVEEEEAGDGRFDMLLRSRDPRRRDVLVEFKRGRDGDEDAMRRMAEEALEQVRSRDYAHRLRDPAVYGIAFCGKKAVVLRG